MIPSSSEISGIFPLEADLSHFEIMANNSVASEMVVCKLGEAALSSDRSKWRSARAFTSFGRAFFWRLSRAALVIASMLILQLRRKDRHLGCLLGLGSDGG